jgi:hypothetical protein
MKQEYASDLENILATQNINGGEFWSTSDGGLAKGVPFSTLETGIMLNEIGLDSHRKEIAGIVDLIFKNIREDGRIRVYPSGTIYPCQTANAARTLCYSGFAQDPRLAQTYRYFLETQQEDGGWRCNASKYGNGPETKFSNPGPTLTVLDVFRFTEHLNSNAQLDKAVEFLLHHWETRLPLGPCHYGIGSLFMKIEFPMVRYNIFHYVYTLSFYDKAKKDPRFLEALNAIAEKMDHGKIVVESTNKKLAKLDFCKLNEPNMLATARYEEILKNLTKGKIN